MGLEQRCDDGDMHISTASIPIIREEKVGVVEENSPAETRVVQQLEERLANPSAPQWPPIVYASLGDAEFWLEIHIGLVAYAVRQLQEDNIARQVAEARVLLVQNDLYRQFRDKVRLSNQVAALEQQIVEDRKEYLEIVDELIYLLDRMKDRHVAVITKLQEAQDLRLHFYRLSASNEIEGKENVIKMYEERFGTREELEKLSAAEENSKLPGMLGPRKYIDVSTLIKQHETGKQPKTIGERMAGCVEKLLNPDTYGNIARAVYRAFRKENNSK